MENAKIIALCILIGIFVFIYIDISSMNRDVQGLKEDMITLTSDISELKNKIEEYKNSIPNYDYEDKLSEIIGYVDAIHEKLFPDRPTIQLIEN